MLKFRQYTAGLTGLVSIQLILIFLNISHSNAQKSKDSLKVTKRVLMVSGAGVGIYSTTLVGLNELWYKGYPKSEFHFFNDNDEWLQMDKVGHAFASYYEGVFGAQMMKWTGVSPQKAAWYGGSWGFLFQTSIEILDGFSSNWGASIGDLTANLSGSVLCIGQQLAWHEQKLTLKYSYTPTKYAPLKPELLGSNLQESFAKDYNGQTYWATVGLADILYSKTKIPKWLNLAVGYGADGMLRGSAADQKADPIGKDYTRRRQFYISPDINIVKLLHTKSKLLNTLIFAFSDVKIPAPAIEFRQGVGLKFHPFYF